MSELGDRLQREEVGLDLGLEVEHDTHDVDGLAAHADARDVRIGRLHARRQLREFRRQVDALEVEHEAVRIPQRDAAGARSAPRLEDDARVFLRRPHARGARCARPAPTRTAAPSCAAGTHQPLAQPPTLDQLTRISASVGRGLRSAARHRSPAAVRAAHRASRPAVGRRGVRQRHVEIRRRQEAAPRAPATRPGRRCRRGSIRQVPPFPIRLDRRTDKNQSDRSINSKTR